MTLSFCNWSPKLWAYAVNLTKGKRANCALKIREFNFDRFKESLQTLEMIQNKVHLGVTIALRSARWVRPTLIEGPKLASRAHSSSGRKPNQNLRDCLSKLQETWIIHPFFQVQSNTQIFPTAITKVILVAQVSLTPPWKLWSNINIVTSAAAYNNYKAVLFVAILCNWFQKLGR